MYTTEKLLASVYSLARTFHEPYTRNQVQASSALCRAVEVLRRALDPRPDRVFDGDRDRAAERKETP